MNAHERIEYNNLSMHLCIIWIWLAVIYSGVIQDKYFQVPGGMLIFGVGILLTFIASFNKVDLDLQMIFPKEILLLSVYMLYMLPDGVLFSPSIALHMNQWVTSVEYLFVLIVIATIIRCSGTNSFHLLLFIEAIILAVIFLSNPIYFDGGRYSISTKVNPNGLGMYFSMGIWGALYFNNKRKIPIAGSLGLSAIFLYGIFLTGSRKALISALIIIGLWFVFILLPEIRTTNWLWGFVVIIFVVLIGWYLGRRLLPAYENSIIADRMRNLGNELSEGHRADLYRYGWLLFKKHPIFGVGFQGFKYYYNLYYSTMYYSHATLVEVPVSGGVIGSCIYILSYVASIYRCVYIFFYYKKDAHHNDELKACKMLLILWVVMLFYTTCIIHPYQLESFIYFGVLFGESLVLYDKTKDTKQVEAVLHNRSKYIK